MAYAMGMGPGFGLGFLNFLGTILFILAIVWVVRTLVRGGPPFGRRGHCRRAAGGGDEALRTAQERLARGEIDGERYGAIRAGLQGSAAGGDGARFGEWLPWNRDQPLEVAKLRFARGEISEEEFASLARALRTQ